MELMMNEFSMNGQFSGIEEFEEYFIKIFKDILDLIQEKNMVLYKLPKILEQPLVEEQTLGDLLLCSRNRAAMAVLRNKIIQILDNPYLDETTCMTESGSSYEYPDKSEEPNCFTEAIERKCPLVSFENERYCQREFFCKKDGQEILLRNIRNQSDLLEVYLEKEPMDVRYVIERYPFVRQIVLAEINDKCYAKEALEENGLEPEDIQKIFKHIPELLEDLQNGRKSHWWDSIESDIFEYRISVSAGREFRLLFFQTDKLYFLNGFIKKTQNTPEREKKKAREIIRELKKIR